METNDTAQIARQLTGLLKEGKFFDAQRQLFSEHAMNVEPEHAAWRSVKGLDAILEKEQRFHDRVKEWQEIKVSEPIIAGNYFSIALSISVVLQSDEPMHVDELIVYQVSEGKIVKEQFFY